MKALYNSSNDDQPISGAGHILVEVGGYGITIVWYNLEEKSVKGIRAFQFNGTDSKDYPAQIQQVLNVSGLEHLHVKLLFNNKESVIVPVEYHKTDADVRMMSLFFGNEDGVTYSGKVHGDDQTDVVFRVGTPVAHYFESRFQGVQFQHATQYQIAACNEGLSCSVYPNYIKVLLVQNNILQLVQYFDYQTPTDVAYHLLNICDIYSLNRETISLYISGMVDHESNLYKECSRYFLNIQPEPSRLSMPESMDSSAHHYFSQLTAAIL